MRVLSRMLVEGVERIYKLVVTVVSRTYILLFQLLSLRIDGLFFCSQGYRLVAIEFEKDDEHNYHVEFVAAASSLRGRNYGIPSTDKLQVSTHGCQ